MPSPNESDEVHDESVQDLIATKRNMETKIADLEAGIAKAHKMNNYLNNLKRMQGPASNMVEPGKNSPQKAPRLGSSRDNQLQEALLANVDLAVSQNMTLKASRATKDEVVVPWDEDPEFVERGRNESNLEVESAPYAGAMAKVWDHHALTAKADTAAVDDVISKGSHAAPNKATVLRDEQLEFTEHDENESETESSTLTATASEAENSSQRQMVLRSTDRVELPEGFARSKINLQASKDTAKQTDKQVEETNERHTHGSEVQSDSIPTKRHGDQEFFQNRTTQVTPNQAGALEGKAESKIPMAECGTLRPQVTPMDAFISDQDEERVRQAAVNELESPVRHCALRDAMIERDAVSGFFRKLLDRRAEAKSSLDLNDTSILDPNKEYQRILKLLATKINDCHKLRILIKEKDDDFTKITRDLEALKEKAITNAKLAERIMTIMETAQANDSTAYKACKTVDEVYAKIGLNEFTHDKFESLPKSMVEETFSSLPKDHLPFLGDDHSEDDIKPGDKVSCVIDSESGQGFHFSEGKMFQIVSLHTGFRAKGLEINEHAIDYDPEGEIHRDSNVSIASSEGEMIEISGAIKSFPLDHFCLAKHWKSKFLALTAVLGSIHFDESRTSENPEKHAIQLKIPARVAARSSQIDYRIPLTRSAVAKGEPRIDQADLVDQNAVPFIASLSIGTSRNLVLSSFISNNAVSDHIHRVIDLDLTTAGESFSAQFLPSDKCAAYESSITPQFTPQFKVYGSIRMPVEIKGHVFNPQFLVCDHIFGQRQYEKSIVAVLGEDFMKSQCLRARLSRAPPFLMVPPQSIEIPPPPPAQNTHLVAYTHGCSYYDTPATEVQLEIDLGNEYSRSGYGIHFPELQGWDMHAAFPVSHIMTAGRAELLAVMRTLKMILGCLICGDGKFSLQLQRCVSSYERVTIYTESDNVVIGFNKHLPKWRDKKFKNARNKPLTDADCWEELDGLVSLVRNKGIRVIMVVVKHEKNQKARELAQQGALQEHNRAHDRFALSCKETMNASMPLWQWTSDGAFCVDSHLLTVDAGDPKGASAKPNLSSEELKQPSNCESKKSPGELDRSPEASEEQPQKAIPLLGELNQESNKSQESEALLLLNLTSLPGKPNQESDKPRQESDKPLVENSMSLQNKLPQKSDKIPLVSKKLLLQKSISCPNKSQESEKPPKALERPLRKAVLFPDTPRLESNKSSEESEQRPQNSALLPEKSKSKKESKESSETSTLPLEKSNRPSHKHSPQKRPAPRQTLRKKLRQRLPPPQRPPEKTILSYKELKQAAVKRDQTLKSTVSPAKSETPLEKREVARGLRTGPNYLLKLPPQESASYAQKSKEDLEKLEQPPRGLQQCSQKPEIPLQEPEIACGKLKQHHYTIKLPPQMSISRAQTLGNDPEKVEKLPQELRQRFQQPKTRFDKPKAGKEKPKQAHKIPKQVPDEPKRSVKSRRSSVTLRDDGRVEIEHGKRETSLTATNTNIQESIRSEKSSSNIGAGKLVPPPGTEKSLMTSASQKFLMDVKATIKKAERMMALPQVPSTLEKRNGRRWASKMAVASADNYIVTVIEGGYCNVNWTDGTFTYTDHPKIVSYVSERGH